MAKSARERLGMLLGGSKAAEFSARLEAPADGVGLEVAGVGPVRLPLRAPQVKKLIAVARPALFGRGEDTLSDSSVRDTWQIPPGQVTLGGPAWPTLLDGALEYFRSELGLPTRSRLRAEPHALLVYGKGQFFLPHQDSEKDDAMVGTLVLSLPSAHTGGELVIGHAGQNRTYRASKTELSLVAFYADCPHEVTRVRSGYRVTLTFNLLVERGAPEQESGPLDDIAHCLEQHFNAPARPRYGGQDLDPPRRLVYLLDHEYTQRGLGWDRLKGADAERAALLRAAATQAECEAVLALAEVKETWDANPAGYDPWDDYGYDDEEEDEDGEGEGAAAVEAAGADEDYELGELIDDEITLGWWTGPDGAGGEQISLYVRDYESCASTPSADLKPYDSQYEGYMGNYGNTLDRWYRRAAVVVWPRERAFAARGEAGSRWALEELQARITTGDQESARAAAESLAPFWKGSGVQPGQLGSALRVAEGLQTPGTAAMLLEPFRIDALTPEHTGGLAAVAKRYGVPWLGQVTEGWFGGAHSHFEEHRYGWTERLPRLCAALCSAGSPEVAQLLSTGAWTQVDGELRLWTETGPAEIRRARLERLSLPLLRILEAADARLRGRIMAALRSCPDTVLECLLPMLSHAAREQTECEPRAAGLAAVARECGDRLGALARRVPRAADDWSVAWTGCGCDLCGTLGAFLGSRSRRTLEWPLAKDGRRHVHSRIDAAELPVDHRTRRQGRPYTLVLTKTEELFSRERAIRRQAGADLAWLASTWNLSGEAGVDTRP
ncbi:2OG-Fe(II) oxygenase [Embleya sp. MST-111070]|uniref:2OG-Fe(II) oxygenase n=1 Tax=Embleya sp. MST-111070 TaxID=3398231 RepID=UPI003F73D4E2